MGKTLLSAVVLGTGAGCQTHVPALRGACFDVAALVGRDAARTAERAARVGVPRAFTSLTDALTRTQVDAVVVATPPNTHAELVLEAVAAGKHVVCEKPFARDKNEALAMLAAAEEAGVVHLVGQRQILKRSAPDGSLQIVEHRVQGFDLGRPE